MIGAYYVVNNIDLNVILIIVKLSVLGARKLRLQITLLIVMNVVRKVIPSVIMPSVKIVFGARTTKVRCLLFSLNEFQ